MGRTLLGSLAGAGAGFVVDYVAVCITAGGQPARDTGAIILFVGSFLAGTGAIAGAVIGGVAELREPPGRRAKKCPIETDRQRGLSSSPDA
jgi:hypothetical protein